MTRVKSSLIFSPKPVMHSEQPWAPGDHYKEVYAL